jgi:hypothetical protein
MALAAPTILPRGRPWPRFRVPAPGSRPAPQARPLGVTGDLERLSAEVTTVAPAVAAMFDDELMAGHALTARIRLRPARTQVSA